MDIIPYNKIIFEKKQEYWDWVIAQHLLVMTSLISKQNAAAQLLQNPAFVPMVKVANQEMQNSTEIKNSGCSTENLMLNVNTQVHNPSDYDTVCSLQCMNSSITNNGANFKLK